MKSQPLHLTLWIIGCSFLVSTIDEDSFKTEENFSVETNQSMTTLTTITTMTTLDDLFRYNGSQKLFNVLTEKFKRPIAQHFMGKKWRKSKNESEESVTFGRPFNAEDGYNDLSDSTETTEVLEITFLSIILVLIVISGVIIVSARRKAVPEPEFEENDGLPESPISPKDQRHHRHHYSYHKDLRVKSKP